MQKEKIICFFKKSLLYLKSKVKVMTIKKLYLILLVFFAGFLLGAVSVDTLLAYSNNLKDRVVNPVRSLEVSFVDEESIELFKRYQYQQDLALITDLANGYDSIHAYYINRYADLSIKEQDVFLFPASVKLAQFLLEGGYSMSNPKGSKLVIEGNNPFGIKYFGNNMPNRIDNWGNYAHYNEYISAKDDCIGNCKFIKFRAVWHSFRYHSIFVAGTEQSPSHYKKYITSGDWSDWLDALEKGGYATSQTYKNSLKDIIVRYKLYLLDDYKTMHL